MQNIMNKYGKNKIEDGYEPDDVPKKKKGGCC
jgi:hypothetical protein